MKKSDKEKNIEEKESKKKKISEKEFEKMVLSFAKDGLTAEKIGEALRKQGIHPKEHERKISKILIENDVYKSPDLKNIEEKLKKIKEHREKNKKDKRAMREVVRVSAQLRRLKSYLKVSV